MTKLIVGINVAEHLIKNMIEIAWQRARTLFLLIINTPFATKENNISWLLEYLGDKNIFVKLRKVVFGFFLT